MAILMPHQDRQLNITVQAFNASPRPPVKYHGAGLTRTIKAIGSKRGSATLTEGVNALSVTQGVKKI